jgi:hypothetical protein
MLLDKAELSKRNSFESSEIPLESDDEPGQTERRRFHDRRPGLADFSGEYEQAIAIVPAPVTPIGSYRSVPPVGPRTD